MKTLYININNEQIQSNDELEVLKHDLDSDFFFYLGEKIAKKCKVENENALITDFNTQDNAEDYQKIIAQWQDLKTILFSEKCEGEFKFTLPNGYIHWLRYSEKYNYVYDKNFSHGESPVISIDLEELYEESVEDLQRKILRKLQRDDMYKEIDEIVFNDDAVTRKSPIIRAIKDKYEGIGFKSYKKWLEESKEKPQGGGDPAPQICEKCGKNPCECNKNEYYYAVEIITGKWESSKYKFYNSIGQSLDDNEYYLVGGGQLKEKIMTNLLVIRTTGDSTLYYISSNGKFHRIGEYDYEKGSHSNNRDNDYYKYEAGIIQNKYILYRNGFNHALYEICEGTAPRLLSQFQTKINLFQSKVEYLEYHQIEETIYICGDFLTNMEYTINWKTGELINISNNRFCIVLGYNNNSPVYLIPPKHWNPEEDSYKNSSVVDSEGKFLWKFTGECFKSLPNNLIEIFNDDYHRIVNLDGKTIFKTDWSWSGVDIEEINGYECLTFDDEYNDKIYIISKGIIVDYLSEKVYVISKGNKANVYDNQTNELISSFNIENIIGSVDGVSSYGLDIRIDLYLAPDEEWGEQGDVYSISHCKKIYTTIGDERFIGSKNDKFIVEGETYFEIYDNQGKLLRTFEKECEDTHSPNLHDNGYISWLNIPHNCIEYYDSLLNPYYIHINKHFKANTDSVEINVLSNRCVIVKAENKELVFVDDVCIAKYNNGRLNQIDEDNYYGYIQDDIEMYCVVNAQRGVIQIPRLENSEFIYLIK